MIRKNRGENKWTVYSDIPDADGKLKSLGVYRSKAAAEKSLALVESAERSLAQSEQAEAPEAPVRRRRGR